MKEIDSIEEIKKRAFSVLCEIDDFCKKNDIKYFLAYGTLLGAIRHSGFIPWDDDIDIMMPRPDYERFNKLYKGNDKFGILMAGDAKYVYSFTKVYDKNTLVIENVNKNARNRIFGLYVDVFPLDGVPQDESKRREISDLIYRDTHKTTIKYTKLSSTNSVLKNILLLPVQFCLLSYRYSKLAVRVDTKSQTYSYDESEYVSCLVWDDKYKYYAKAWYGEVIEHEFEGKMFPIPSEYDKMLTYIYGNYMELPPKEEQCLTHGYKVFLKDEI